MSGDHVHSEPIRLYPAGTWQRIRALQKRQEELMAEYGGCAREIESLMASTFEPDSPAESPT